MLDPAAAEEEEVAGAYGDAGGGVRDLVVNAVRAEFEGVVVELPAEAARGDPLAAPKGDKRHDRARFAVDLGLAVDELDGEAFVDDADTGLTPEAGEHAEVGEGVVGATASGADDVDGVAAFVEAERDRLLEVGGVGVGVGADAVGGDGLAGVADRVEVAGDDVGHHAEGEGRAGAAVGGDDQRGALTELVEQGGRGRLAVGDDEGAHGHREPVAGAVVKAALRWARGRTFRTAPPGRRTTARDGQLATVVGRIARMSTTTADKARIEAQIALIPRLRGTGPNPFDYDQWDARTAEILTAAFGADSDEVARYQRVVGEAGRVAGVRGNAGNMTLNIHGQWGILERLERAESLLRELASG